MGFGHNSPCHSPMCLWPRGLLFAAYPRLNPLCNGASQVPQSGCFTGDLWACPHLCCHTLQLLRGKGCSFITPCSRYRDAIVWFGLVNWHRQGFFPIFCVAFIWTHFSVISLLRSQIWDQKSSPSYHLHSAYHISLSSAWAVCIHSWKVFILDFRYQKLMNLWSNGCILCTVIVLLSLLWFCQVIVTPLCIKKPFKILSFPRKCGIIL